MRHVTVLVTAPSSCGTNQNASIPDQFSLRDFGRELPTTFDSTQDYSNRSTKPIGLCWFSSSYTMGIWDAFSEIVEAVTPWSVVEAEAPAAAPQVSRSRHPL